MEWLQPTTAVATAPHYESIRIQLSIKHSLYPYLALPVPITASLKDVEDRGETAPANKSEPQGREDVSQ
jgi:hypothetical protein